MNHYEILKELSVIRQKRRQLWWMLWGYIPAMAAVYAAARLLGVPSESTDPILVPAALIWMAGFTICGARVIFAKCPRCGEYFHQRRIGLIATWDNAFTQQCVNCKLPLNEQPR